MRRGLRIAGCIPSGTFWVSSFVGRRADAQGHSPPARLLHPGGKCVTRQALLLDRSLRFSPQESALEQGWLLWEMEQRLGYSLEDLARRFDRSVSWVSRRLALVELLP